MFTQSARRFFSETSIWMYKIWQQMNVPTNEPTEQQPSNRSLAALLGTGSLSPFAPNDGNDLGAAMWAWLTDRDPSRRRRMYRIVVHGIHSYRKQGEVRCNLQLFQCKKMTVVEMRGHSDSKASTDLSAGILLLDRVLMRWFRGLPLTPTSGRHFTLTQPYTKYWTAPCGCIHQRGLISNCFHHGQG